MGNNGDNDGKEIRKKCPFLGEWCIGSICALNTELVRNEAGLLKKFNACSFSALTVMISELNNKTQAPQPQKIQLPGILRG